MASNVTVKAWHLALGPAVEKLWGGVSVGSGASRNATWIASCQLCLAFDRSSKWDLIQVVASVGTPYLDCLDCLGAGTASYEGK